jgi:hyperosmotically inducible protein
MSSKLSSRLISVLFGAVVLVAPTLTARTAQPQSDPQQQPPPDNTKSNKGDSSQGAVTADQQKMNAADQEITKKIRSAIVKDKSLSTYAHNVKIITRKGKVTLKGPVRTEEEKSNVEAKATAVAGDGNVMNQLTVTPPKT